MVQVLTKLTGALLWWTGLVLSRKVHQSPAELVIHSGDSMQLNCSHAIPSHHNILWYHRPAGDSALKFIGKIYLKLFKNVGQSSTFSCSCEDKSYVRMFWYQQPVGEGTLKLIGLLYRENLTPGDHLSDRFRISGDATKTGTLEISNLTSEDAAVYFCAMSAAHCCRCPSLLCRNLFLSHKRPYSWHHALKQQNGPSAHQVNRSLALVDRLVISRKVNQSPAELVKDSGDSMQLNCSHAIPSHHYILCVHQSPSTLLNHTGESVQLSCSHNILNYDTILWYQQPQQGNGMKLIGRVYFNNPEMEGEKRFNVSGDGRWQAFLNIDKLEAKDSCTYFCAMAQCRLNDAGLPPAVKQQNGPSAHQVNRSLALVDRAGAQS
ncbi:hypothetical protein SKAU_G00332010 [Synaphobranchus kaupii]|uniref:Ig-like domain-containing protein n=1 Tax=Synaphobranchus kaupii TaxID=118154 RepID=A0A9Q1ELC0_SYNKA|nr:hypothetical protein SKAU_G00332010 [Synaphobranchus kaupii]